MVATSLHWLLLHCSNLLLARKKVAKQTSGKRNEHGFARHTQVVPDHFGPEICSLQSRCSAPPAARIMRKRRTASALAFAVAF